VDLIRDTFSKQLTSSESAFDLLRKFQDIDTRDKIKQLLDEKYKDVLIQYKHELNSMNELFTVGQVHPPISKNMPFDAGRIAWARSIMGRIKAPIKKFKTKSEKLYQPESRETFKEVATKYVKLAKDLDKGYEEEIFNKWRDENTNKAIKHLQENILSKKRAGQYNIYEVNFSPELRVTIREAKFLSRIGK
jgi:hypothetical protein